MPNGQTGAGRPTAGATRAGGSVGSVVSGDPGIVVTASGGVDTVSQLVGASWPLGLTRVYAIDPVSGNDANVGFADAATSSAGDYAVACALAGTRAKKTIAGLVAIFPRWGAGRIVEVVIANGGVNTQGTFAETLGQLLSGVSGYASASPVVRGTGTNTTAGCTKFDGSAADVTYQGCITVTGLNVAGYNPTAGATTVSVPCQLAGGGAAALPAEPLAPLGWRIRFDAATATVGLRNQCRQVAQVTGGNTIIPQTAFSAAPGLTDVFYLEQAGVAVSVADVVTGCEYASPSNVALGILGVQITCIRWTSTITFNNIEARLAMSGGSGFATSGNSAWVALGQTLGHPVLGSVTVGGGFRAEATATTSTFSGSGRVGATGLVIGGNAYSFSALSALQWGAGSYVSGALTWINCTFPVAFEGSGSPQIGVTAGAVRSPRAARLQAINVRGTIGLCAFEGAGANPAIKVTGTCDIAFSGGICSGTVGNNDVGLDLTLARGCLITLGSILPTVTGALGDVRLAGGQIVTWASVAATGVVDGGANKILAASGTGIPSSAPVKFTAALFGGAGAVLSYAADTAPTLLVANEIVATRYPTSMRLLGRLRVTVLALSTNTINNTVTLFKNGVATAMTLIIPPATAAFTKFADTTHPILFADGDDFTLQMANAGADAAAVCKIAAIVEAVV